MYVYLQNPQLLTLDLPQLWEHQSSAWMSHSHLTYRGTGSLKLLKSRSLLIQLRFQPHLCVGEQQVLTCSQSPALCEHSVGPHLSLQVLANNRASVTDPSFIPHTAPVATQSTLWPLQTLCTATPSALPKSVC